MDTGWFAPWNFDSAEDPDFLAGRSFYEACTEIRHYVATWYGRVELRVLAHQARAFCWKLENQLRQAADVPDGVEASAWHVTCVAEAEAEWSEYFPYTGPHGEPQAGIHSFQPVSRHVKLYLLRWMRDHPDAAHRAEEFAKNLGTLVHDIHWERFGEEIEAQEKKCEMEDSDLEWECDSADSEACVGYMNWERLTEETEEERIAWENKQPELERAVENLRFLDGLETERKERVKQWPEARRRLVELMNEFGIEKEEWRQISQAQERIQELEKQAAQRAGATDAEMRRLARAAEAASQEIASLRDRHELARRAWTAEREDLVAQNTSLRETVEAAREARGQCELRS